MSLGAFSVSLTVKDLSASLAFYEKLGFEIIGGDEKMNYFILKNGNAVIGLFQGMFENNMITFNPGFDESGNTLSNFKDVRKIQRDLKSANVVLETEVETASGPGNFMVKDPDGNQILVDQHV